MSEGEREALTNLNTTFLRLMLAMGYTIEQIESEEWDLEEILQLAEEALIRDTNLEL